MLNRRDFTLGAGAIGAAARFRAGPGASHGSHSTPASDRELNLYGLDVGAATLTPRGWVTLPANVQYAWPHPSRKFLYVAASNGQPGSGPMGATGADRNHYAIAFRVGAGRQPD